MSPVSGVVGKRFTKRVQHDGPAVNTSKLISGSFHAKVKQEECSRLSAL